MNRRQIILDVRNSGRLKAMKPCLIYLKANIGNIYTKRQSDFIMSMRDDTIYFQKISFLFHHLQPKGDFSINIKNYESYAIVENKANNVLYLYTHEHKFIEIFYDKLTNDTIMTQDNISRIIKVLEEKGIKKIKIGEDDGE